MTTMRKGAGQWEPAAQHGELGDDLEGRDWRGQRAPRRRDVRMPMTDSLHCAAETNTSGEAIIRQR